MSDKIIAELQELRKQVDHFAAEYQDEVGLSMLRQQQQFLIEALLRADKLISWLSQGMKHISPGAYKECYKELNEHYNFMATLNKG